MKPWIKHLLIFLLSVAVVAGIGTPVALKLYPTLVLGRYQQAISSGFGTGHRIPDNTLYTFPEIFSPDSAHGNPYLNSANQDGLYTFGNLTADTATITLPDTNSRYQAVELVNPSTGVAKILHGPLTTKITGPRLIIGRTYAANNADIPAALALANKIKLTPTSK